MESTGGDEDVTQEHVDQINPARANVATTRASVLMQTQTVLFKFQKPTIDGKNIGRSTRAAQLLLRVRENFFEMTRHPRLGARGIHSSIA